MSVEQLQTLITILMTAHGHQTQQLLIAARQGAPEGAQGGVAAVVGQLKPCALGREKMKRYKKLKDWVKDAETKMEYHTITTNDKKLAYIKSQAGPELLNFWENEIRVKWDNVQADPERGECPHL